MQWEDPTFCEIKMDAEIGAYQSDFEPLRVTSLRDWYANDLDLDARAIDPEAA
jgi:hypothetical protein